MRNKVVCEYNCLMLDVELNNWSNWEDIITPTDIYISDTIPGLEPTPHITLLHGIEPNTRLNEFGHILPRANEYNVEVGGLQYFNKSTYDVLFLKVKCSLINEVNLKLKETIKYHPTFPVYTPHITIAYLKPGKANKYVYSIPIVNKHIKAINYTYSTTKNRPYRFKEFYGTTTTKVN